MIKFSLAGALVGALAIAAATPAQAGETFDAVKQRGQVVCGVHTGNPGFSAPDNQGQWHGLDIDLCRAIAAALFGDPSKTSFVPTSSTNRFTALQTGEVDVLTRNATQTLTRDSTLGLNMAGVNFYDGQGFMVPAALGVTEIEELAGASICVLPGTTTELNLADYFGSRGLSYSPVVIDSADEMYTAFFRERCDAVTTDASALAANRATRVPNPEDYVILPERISKEPLGPMVRQGDEEWYNLVTWVLAAMIEAEELGITQENVDAMLESDNPAIQRVLGVTPGFGEALGVDEGWAYNVIKAVGNYGDSFERNLGAESPIGLERGLNDLWTRGGLMYALPLR